MTECLECSEDKNEGVKTTDGFVCATCLDQMYMREFIQDLESRLPENCEIVNKPTDKRRDYVYRILVEGYDNEYVEVRTNGESYIVNYFISEENPGASATAKDFVQKPIEGSKPWKELLENILTSIKRLDYTD